MFTSCWTGEDFSSITTGGAALFHPLGTSSHGFGVMLEVPACHAVSASEVHDTSVSETPAATIGCG